MAAGLVDLGTARAYLRVDSTYEDALIEGLLEAASSIVLDVGRLTEAELEGVRAVAEGREATVTVRGEERGASDVSGWPAVLMAATLYTLAYLYEHREAADLHGLVLTLRGILFQVREGVL